MGTREELRAGVEEDDVVVRLPLPCPRAATLTLLWAAQGLLLDLDAATLTVWVNGERKGVMVHPGMTDEYGQPVGRLEGPLRWAVDLYHSCSRWLSRGPCRCPLPARNRNSRALGERQSKLHTIMLQRGPATHQTVVHPSSPPAAPPPATPPAAPSTTEL